MKTDSSSNVHVPLDVMVYRSVKIKEDSREGAGRLRGSLLLAWSDPPVASLVMGLDLTHSCFYLFLSAASGRLFRPRG